LNPAAPGSFFPIDPAACYTPIGEEPKNGFTGPMYGIRLVDMDPAADFSRLISCGR
jgi:hypothetical protein